MSQFVVQGGVIPSLRKNSPLTRGLIGLWIPGVGGRTGSQIRDLSGKENHGSIAGGIDWDGGGGTTQSLLYDGTDHVSCGSVIPTYPFSVSLWFRTNQDTANTAMISISDTGTASNQHALVYRGDGAGDSADGNVQAVSRAGSITFSRTNMATSTTTTNLNEWYHATGVWRSATYRAVYINGILEGTATASSSPTSIDSTDIGRLGDSSPNWEFEGNIGDTLLYDREISPSEIYQLYQFGRGGSGILSRSKISIPASGASPAARSTVTRLGLSATPQGLYGSFSGKTPDGGGGGIVILRRRMEA